MAVALERHRAGAEEERTAALEYQRMHWAFFGDLAADDQLAKKQMDDLARQFEQTVVDPMRPVAKSEDFEGMFLAASSATKKSDKNGSVGLPLPEPGSVKSDQVLSDKDLVALAYPANYLETLKLVQKEMTAGGFLSAETQYTFDSLENVNAFANKWIDYLKFQGKYSDEDARDAKYGVNVKLAELNSREALLKKRVAMKSNFLRHFAVLQKKVLAREAEQKFKKFNFFTKEADAAYCGWVEYIRYPNCFTPLPGRTPGYTYFMPACSGYGCYMYLGCLSSCKSYMGAAIYNQYYRLCGCA